MINALRRARCRLFHSDQSLKASRIGQGTTRCSLCDVGFTDLLDAGRLRLDPLDVFVSPQRLARLEKDSAAGPRPQLEGGLYRVMKGGRTVRVGRIA